MTGISTDVCLAFPAITALADGFDTYAVVDASGGFSQTQVEMGVQRMIQAGVVPVCYSDVAVEILGDNAAPERRRSIPHSVCHLAGWYSA